MYLFPDAELREDLAEDFVGGDEAGDGAEGCEGGAEVLRQEVGGDAAVEAVGDGGEGSGGLPERRGVARVGDECAGGGGDAGAGGKGGAQLFEPGAVLRGDAQRRTAAAGAGKGGGAGSGCS